MDTLEHPHDLTSGEIQPHPPFEAQASENLSGLYENLGNIQNDFRNRNLYVLLTRQLKAVSLLDIGSGAGHFLNHARQKGLQTTGIEPNAALIALSEKLYGSSSRTLNIGIDQIDRLGALRYDNITMLDVLEHIQDDVSLLKKLRHFLKKDGRLIILAPCYRHLYGIRDKKLGHYRRYERSELIAKLHAAGYEILRCRFWNMLGYFAYAISEKLLKKEIPTSLRTAGRKNSWQRFCVRALAAWLEIVENHIHLGFGLSLLCVAIPRTSPNATANPENQKGNP